MILTICQCCIEPTNWCPNRERLGLRIIALVCVIPSVCQIVMQSCNVTCPNINTTGAHTHPLWVKTKLAGNTGQAGYPVSWPGPLANTAGGGCVCLVINDFSKRPWHRLLLLHGDNPNLSAGLLWQTCEMNMQHPHYTRALFHEGCLDLSLSSCLFLTCYHSVPNLSRENRKAVLGYDPITKSHIFSYSLFVPLCQAIKAKQS